MKIKSICTAYLYVLLCLSFSLCHAASVDTVQIYSQKMRQSFPAIIVSPENRNQVNLPVVYLLHGYSGSYLDWINNVDLASLADQYNFIIVCPDGGFAGWYIDSPEIGDSQYETYVALEVVDYVDQHFLSIPERKSRALCGLSMGGHGALSLLVKYPERFSAAGSISGVMDLAFVKDKYQISSLLGKFEDYPLRWKKNTCLNLVEGLNKDIAGLIIDCGIEDVFLESNRAIHKKLLELNIPHEYYERPGGHCWNYWVNALDFHFLYFSKTWANN